MNIPDEAVEAAARALWDKEMNAPWSSVADGFKGPFLRDARQALEAAAPHMMADLNDSEPVLAEPSLTRTLKVETYDGSTVDARVTILPAVIVASEEQLNELPAGSVVLSVETLHHEGGWPIAYQRWQDGDWHRGGRASSTHPDKFLPVTILHRPTQ